MVKSYLRYVASSCLGVIASPVSHVVVDASGQLAFTPALENVCVWNIRKGVLAGTLSVPSNDFSSKPDVTALALSPRGSLLAVGYMDGSTRLFDYTTGAVRVVLNGHRKAVTALAFAGDGLQLASGSKDTDAVVWDVVAEAGTARLRAHRDEVTDVAFMESAAAPRLLLTCSKDTLLRVWSMATYACVATIVGARAELWSLCALPAGDRVLAGSSDDRLRVWATGRKPRASILPPGAAASAVEADADAKDDVLHGMGALARVTKERASRVRCSSDGSFIGVQAAGRIIEVFRRRDAVEVRKRVLRRLRRHREKLGKRARAVAAAAVSGRPEAVSSGSAGQLAEEGDAVEPQEEEEEDEDAFAPLGASLADVEALLARIQGENGTSATAGTAHNEWVIASDELELVGVVQASVKIASFAFIPAPTASSILLFVTTQGNEAQVHRLALDAATAASLKAADMITPAGTKVLQSVVERSIHLSGHRGDVRAIAVSSDGSMIISAGAGAAKVWNAKTGAAIRTLPLGEDATAVGLAVAFCPGDKHALVALKDGRVILFDLASGDALQQQQAHEGAVWSIAMRPNGKGFATGSADKEVKFWEFELPDADDDAPASAAAPSSRALEIVHVRTLKLTDEVLSIKYTHHSDPSKLLLAVALLDNTVKIFFDDTLRFFLSLYGHKLPVMSMDVSADSTLLVTASADKNVKLWGLDFGDCHKSFFAHDDSVTAVAFLARTHYFFTAGKDRRVKYWDGDRFESILTLEGHKSEVWCLAAAKDGTFIVSGSHDRSIRVWRRTEQQVFLEEEREREMDTLIDVATRDPDGDAIIGGVGDAVGPVGADGLAAPAAEDAVVTTVSVSGMALPETSLIVAQASKDAAKGSDRLIEALTLAGAETAKWMEYAQDLTSARAAGDADNVVTTPTRNPELLGLTPAAYVLRTLRQVRPGDVDQVILVLPFSDALQLLRYMYHLLRLRQGVELCSRVALLILRMHSGQIVATATLLPLVTGLRDTLHAAVSEVRDLVGINAAGLRFLDKTLQEAAAAAARLPVMAPTASLAALDIAREKRAAARAAAAAEHAGTIRAGKRQHARIF